MRRFAGRTENHRERIRGLISHWDEAENDRAELGHLAARWTDLAEPPPAAALGVNRIEIDPGMWSTPAHIEAAEEEIFFVLGGSGWSWQQHGAEGEVRMHEVRERDCIQGLDVVAIGDHVPTQSRGATRSASGAPA